MLSDTINDTIVAIATPPGAGGVGIIRISGVNAPLILKALFHRFQQPEQPWQSHRLYLGRIIDPASGILLDTALAVLMEAPHSYTRQHVVELHCHGGPALLAKVVSVCVEAGARPAQRGEFTLRAFLNGALSLAEAEAVADLVSAPTAAGAQLAAAQLDGGLQAYLHPLEQELLQLLAQLTVALDFPEDGDAPAGDYLISRIRQLLQQTGQLLAGAELGRIYREGYRVVLVGASNVGKSSLLNQLLAEERAIVSAQPGTTRDIIEESLNLEGLPLVLKDTAGLRQDAAVDEAEQIGMERSRRAFHQAQLVLVVIDAAQGLDETAQALLGDVAGRQWLLIVNKRDLLNIQQLQSLEQSLGCQLDSGRIVAVSAKSGAGLPRLRQLLKEQILALAPEKGQTPLVSNLRHQQALLRCEESMREALAALEQGLPLDMAAIDLQNAWQALGEISGKTVSEEVLTEIFANFCVGK